MEPYINIFTSMSLMSELSDLASSLKMFVFQDPGSSDMGGVRILYDWSRKCMCYCKFST